MTAPPTSARPTLLVLAAGMGSRYGGLKQMDPMGPNGETVLDYSVFDAIHAGFGKVVFVIREEFFEAFRDAIGARFADKIEVAYAFQKLDDLPQGFSVPNGRTKPWGTAHAILAARHLVDTPFAVINADDFYGADAYRRAATFFQKPTGNSAAEFAMVGYPLANTLSEHGEVNRGICATRSGDLLESVEEYLKIAREPDGVIRGQALDGERRAIADNAPVSMNFWAFPAEFFAALAERFSAFLAESGGSLTSECYIPTVVDTLIREGDCQCRVLTTTGHWFGVTYPQDKPHVMQSIAALIAHGEYPSPLA